MESNIMLLPPHIQVEVGEWGCPTRMLKLLEMLVLEILKLLKQERETRDENLAIIAHKDAFRASQYERKRAWVLRGEALTRLTRMLELLKPERETRDENLVVIAQDAAPQQHPPVVDISDDSIKKIAKALKPVKGRRLKWSRATVAWCRRLYDEAKDNPEAKQNAGKGRKVSYKDAYEYLKHRLANPPEDCQAITTEEALESVMRAGIYAKYRDSPAVREKSR